MKTTAYQEEFSTVLEITRACLMLHYQSSLVWVALSADQPVRLLPVSTGRQSTPEQAGRLCRSWRQARPLPLAEMHQPDYGLL